LLIGGPFINFFSNRKILILFEMMDQKTI
jgi:hypothetical protein